MKKFLLRLWRNLPFWAQQVAASILHPRYQVAVGGVIFIENGQLLLCEHTYRCLHPWGLSGGDLKVGEDPVNGINPEILDETGLTERDARLLLAENPTEINQISLTYLCTGVGGIFAQNEEVASIYYCDPKEFPGFFREHQVTIEKCLAILNSEMS
jgi:ADP-ribose pyrophosphatase YjhB (NUDIX family)